MKSAPLLGFAEALDTLLREHNMKPAELARRLDVWSGDVSRWRHGGGISIQNVRRVADLFGVPRADLEALAGYGPDSQAHPRRPQHPHLEQVVARQARELAEDLRTVSAAMWPAILSAQRAARRAAIEVARLRSDQFAADLAEGQATGRGAQLAPRRRVPNRYHFVARRISRNPNQADYLYQTIRACATPPRPARSRSSTRGRLFPRTDLSARGTVVLPRWRARTFDCWRHPRP